MLTQSEKTIAMRAAFGETLLELADKVPELVVLDADVSSSTQTIHFGKAHPDRFFNCGVAEAGMVDMAGGMATCGLKPVVSTFALFLSLKCTDQIRNVLAYNRLPVVMAGGYAGVSDSFDGASHQSVADIAVMRALPNVKVVVPGDGVEVKQALEQALDESCPVFLRICRNPTPVLFEDAEPLKIGRIRRMRKGDDLTIAVCGVPTAMAAEAAQTLAGEGIEVDLLEVSTIKPLDVETLVESVGRTGAVLTVEEHSIIGGLGGAIAEALASHHPAPMDMIGFQDRYGETGPYEELLAKLGISVEAILEKSRRLVSTK